MSTSLDVYPFHEVRQDAARAAIAHYFSKLTGLSNISIEIAVHNENGSGQMRWLNENECLVFVKNVWYSAWEKKYVKAGAAINVIDAALVVENPSKYGSPLVSISDIHLQRTPMLLLQLCVAIGIAQVMGNESVLHCGDFGWVVGLHKTSPYTAGNEALLREGYVNEFDIPISLIEKMCAVKKTDSIEEAVATYFADKDGVG